MSGAQGFEGKVAFIWRIADHLRGTFKRHEYGSVMLPLLVLRRLDAVLEPTKAAVLTQVAQLGANRSGRATTTCWARSRACRSTTPRR